MRLSLLVATSLLLVSCTRPVLIMQASSDDLQLEVDGFVDVSNDLEIAYDYWSRGGVPFISLLNTTSDTLYLDLNRSRYEQRKRSLSFDEFVEPYSEFEDASENSNPLVFQRVDRRQMLVLAPQKWASFYGPTCHDERSIRRGDPSTFSYSYRSLRDSISKEVVHRFNLDGINRIKRKEISSYERQNAGPDLYYVNKDEDIFQNQNTWMILDILVTVLFAI